MAEHGDGAVILLVEDDIDLNTANRRALELRQYIVHTAHSLVEAKGVLAKVSPDLILLDVMLPDGDGFSFCAEIRSETDAHIIFLTAKTEYVDRITGLDTGGDDYITKPFHVGEMLSRVNAVLRRRRSTSLLHPAQIVIGPLVIDTVSNRSMLSGSDLPLTAQEAAILRKLASNEGKYFDGEDLYKMIWAQPIAGNKNSLWSAISRLRKKISPGGYDIVYHRKSGYALVKK